MALGRYDAESQIITGQQLRDGAPRTGGGGATIPATRGSALNLTPEMLSKHVLALGSIGSGKTNSMFHIVRSILRTLSEGDRMVIFDAKGDYEDEFREPRDVVIGSRAIRNGVWNMFADLMDTPMSPPDVELLRQLAGTLFSKQIKTSNNPTFPSGARDLFVGLTLAFIRREQSRGNASWDTLNNATLKAFFTGEIRNPANIGELIDQHPDLGWLRMYILAPNSATTQSYLAPLLAVVNEMFTCCFAQPGSFSIRRYITHGGSGKLFISYDAEFGCMMDAVYTVLLDLAMRQSIGRSARNGGNIYFILDELPVIPALTYLDQIINFGRSLGIKVVAGIQNTSQMDDKYGEHRAVSVLSGFSTYLCFHLFDEKSRALVKERHGTNMRRISCLKRDGQTYTEILEPFDVIEDWEIAGLHEGRCIVSLPSGEPFRFHPSLYQRRQRPASAQAPTITIVRTT